MGLNKMNKKLLQIFKNRLEKKKQILEQGLQKFADKDQKLKGDWDTRFPQFGKGDLSEAADEIEEYATLLPIEHALELRLRDINLALDKIKKRKYGKCEKCKKDISEQRLNICPEARFCLKCLKKRKKEISSS